jgi:hypothetical protein
MSEERVNEENKARIHKSREQDIPRRHAGGSVEPPLAGLQRLVGNRAVQRMLAQRSGDGSFQLDDETANRINAVRGGGQAVDGAVQAQMEQVTGHDFSGVKVHTSSEADALSQQLGAKAFTTGKDIFFRGGAYAPGSSAGQQLLAHEMTHVAQQSSGAVSGVYSGAGMTVNAPHDQFEQEADQIAERSSVQAARQPEVQRQEVPEEEEMVSMQREESLQRQEMDEDEEVLSMQRDEALQRQAQPEEEEELVSMQRDPAVEAIQRQEVPEEEELVSMKRDTEANTTRRKAFGV